MLVLNRRVGESLLIGAEVEVEVLDISGGQVKIGIRAPREISILRGELLVTIRQNEAAAESASDGAIDCVLKSIR